MSNKYRLAIVGCGGHARGTLAPLWKDIPEIEPVAACEANAESLASFAEALGINNTYSDLETMLAEQQPDILIVATWPASHRENVLQAVRGGVRAIFCEKPIALNADEAKEMVEAARAADVVFMEGFMHLYHAQLRELKRIIAEGAIGDVRFIRASFSTGTGNRTNWRRRGELGGGAAMDLGCYCVSSIRYLIGAEPLSISASGNFDEEGQIWETLLGTLDFSDGVLAQFECSFGLPRRGSCEIVGTDGVINIPRTAWSWPRELDSGFTLTQGDYRDVKTETVEITAKHPYREQLLDLCNSLSTGEPPSIPSDDSVANMRVIDAIHESARTGQRVDIDG